MIATSSLLTTPATSIPRVKYFPLEVYVANMLPNTVYDCYANGAPVNAFCKPYGGRLGASLAANSSGQLLFQYMMAMPYVQTFVVNPQANAVTGLVTSQLVLSLVDPFGNQSTLNVPLTYKSGSAQ